MYRKFGKRCFDTLLSLFALPLVILLGFIIAPLIWREDKGPVLYIAPRLGRNGKVFMMYKFRSMKTDSPDIRNEDGSTFNAPDDERATKIGKILRKTSIDELPQVWNVIKGEMSFVGPRPNLATIPYQSLDEANRKRLVVKPGITGYSQALFRNCADASQRIATDLQYVDQLNFFLDCKILILTLFSVIQRKNIYSQSSATRANSKG